MVFTIYGHGGHLGHVTRTIWTNFRSPILRSLHMKFEFNWLSGFRGEDVWKCWRTDAGHWSHWYTNRSPRSLRLRWANKEGHDDHVSLTWIRSPGPEVTKLFLCSTQLSTKFIMLINFKMPTIVGILTFISMINTTSESLKPRKVFNFQHFSFYEKLKFHSQLSGAWKMFCNLGAWRHFC